MLIDSHSHIYDEEFEPVGGAQAIVDSMSADGLGYLLAVGCDVPSSRQCVELAQKYVKVYATVGVHPYDADTVTPENISVLRALAGRTKVVAAGEIGLDYHRPNSDRTGQLAAMSAQYDLARELELPMIFHMRDSYGDFTEFCKTREFPNGAVLHCFSSSAEVAEHFVKKGFYISFSGTVTYKNAVNLWRAAEAVPTDRLLIETDSPYLTPEPIRHGINYPKNVAYVRDKLAELRRVSPEEIEIATAQNAMKVFGING